MNRLIFSLCFPIFAHGDTLLSVEYPMRISILEGIRSTFEQATQRPDKGTSYLAAVYTESGMISPYFLSCGVNQPEVTGEGCELIIKARDTGAPGEVHMSFVKKFSAPKFKSVLAAVEELLKTDPNLVDENDHRHFGNPISDDALDASHFFCASEGVAPAKNWACYYFVAERIK